MRGPEARRNREMQCKGANQSGAPVQKCKGERHRFGLRVAASGGGWRGGR